MSGPDRRKQSLCLCATHIVAAATMLAMHLLPSQARAQPTSAILSGRIVDESHAVVADVEVAVVDVATGLERKVKTSATGEFTFPLLPPARYLLTAQRDGFAPLHVPDLVLNVNDRITLSLTLTVAPVGETVRVAAVARVNTASAVATVVDRQFVENLPLNGRSFQSLIALTPGIVLTAGATNSRGQFSVNGQRPTGNAFMVDGVSANFATQPGVLGAPGATGNLPALTTFGSTQSLASVDAVEEFKVQTSSYSAEFGRQPGGQVSIVTRSGTNQFHGSAFNYLRNDAFDANNWFANANGLPKAALRQNDFGGTFAGPALLPGYNGRNRTFFFVSYEGLRMRVPQFALSNVPTVALRQQAPAQLQPILNGFPLPKGRDLGNGLAELTESYSNPSHLDATSVRIDHSFANALSTFVRYSRSPSATSSRTAYNLSSIGTAELSPQTVTIGATMPVTSRALNDLRVNYSVNRARAQDDHDDFGGAVVPPRGIVIPAEYEHRSAHGRIGLASASFVGSTGPGIGIAGPGVEYGGVVTDQSQFNLIDTLSYGVGAHHLKFGIDYRRLQPVFEANSYYQSVVFRSAQEVLAARPTVSISTSYPRRAIVENLSLYAQDTWKAGRRLTLDFGVRWELNPAPTETNGREQPAATQIDDPATMDLAPIGTRPWKTTYNNWAPRIGAAYLLSEAPARQTLLRGAFGVFFDTGSDFAANNYNQGFPFRASRSLDNVSFPLSPADAVPPPLPIDGTMTPPYTISRVFDPDLELPYTLQWNVSVEQSLGANQTIEVSYVGAAGRRLLQLARWDLRQVNPNFTTIDVTTNSASSEYRALQLSFQRRLSRGLQALTSYTWSRALDDDSSSYTGREAQWGYADFDVRHVFSAAVTYDVPSPAGSDVVKALLRDWGIDLVMHAQSASAVDLVAATLIDPVDFATINVRPNVNPGVAWYVDDPAAPGGRRINREAFSIPPTGQSGDLGRNQLRGLPVTQTDLALRRVFRLTDRLRLQMRVEAFNVFNQPNFGAIQTNLTAANFGQATNTLNQQLGGLNQLYQMGGPRSMQFSLKLQF